MRSSSLAICVLVCLWTGDGAAAAKFKTLHTFAGAPGDGNEPNAQLLADSSGNFWSTTIQGGASDYGTVFKMAPDGTMTIVYSFAGPPNDGGASDATLIEDRNGDFYGTTIAGGADNNGTIFKLTPAGVETTLYAFKNNGDGAEPFVGVVADKKGNLYGTTYAGGVNGEGTVFKLSSHHKETILHSFAGSDGSGPMADVILDESGNLYGTATAGGASNDGVVFEIAPDGTETVLYSFSGTDGMAPYGGVTLDKSGNLYGTTGEGGADGGGIIFKLTSGGTESVLYSFAGRADGGFPSGNLVFDHKRNIYGTTVYGGNDGTNGCQNRGGCGVVYRLEPSGTLKVLHAFTGTKDGGNPASAVTLDKSGAIYGTAGFGGADQDGTVFRIN